MFIMTRNIEPLNCCKTHLPWSKLTIHSKELSSRPNLISSISTIMQIKYSYLHHSYQNSMFLSATNKFDLSKRKLRSLPENTSLLFIILLFLVCIHTVFCVAQMIVRLLSLHSSGTKVTREFWIPPFCH